MTRDSYDAAAAYATRFGWQVELLSVSRLARTDEEYSLISKTPWVFVFDSQGVLRFQDHGGQLERLEGAVGAMLLGRTDDGMVARK